VIGKRRGEEAPVPKPSDGGETPSEPDPADIRVAYQEVCKSPNVIDDFRARLLALLPLSSGAGIFLLLATTPDGNVSNQDYLGAIGVIGGLISVGLFAFEVRQILVCRHLIRVGANLERDYMHFGKVDGQFLGRPPPPLPPLPSNDREKSRGISSYASYAVSVIMASSIVYLTVIAGWAYVASVGFH
jgi:hypothetical protein